MFWVNVIFLGIPVLITGLNLWNVFSKRKIIPRVLIFLTVILGIFFYLVYLGYRDVLGVEWNEPIYYYQKHTEVSNEFRLSFWVLLAVGIASLFTLALVPAKNSRRL